MKTLYVCVFLTAAVATAAALPPLGSLLGFKSFGKSVDSYEEYEYDELNLLADNSTVDYDNSTITDNPSSPGPTDDPNNSTPDPGDNGDKTLSGGAIAGIVIGSIAGVALIAGGVYYMKVKGMACFG